MEARVSQPLNQAQLLLLQTFSNIKSEEEKEDIQALLLEYYQKRVDKQAHKLWDEQNWTNEKVEEILNSHLRTAYK